MAIDEHKMEEAAAAGLPAPRIEGLGGIQVAHLGHEVRP